MTLIRALFPDSDATAVRHLFDRAADYIDLETGELPSDATVADFLRLRLSRPNLPTR